MRESVTCGKLAHVVVVHSVNRVHGVFLALVGFNLYGCPACEIGPNLKSDFLTRVLFPPSFDILILLQMQDFFKNNNLLSEKQGAFWGQSALVYSTENVKTAPKSAGYAPK